MLTVKDWQTNTASQRMTDKEKGWKKNKKTHQEPRKALSLTIFQKVLTWRLHSISCFWMNNLVHMRLQWNLHRSQLEWDCEHQHNCLESMNDNHCNGAWPQSLAWFGFGFAKSHFQFSPRTFRNEIVERGGRIIVGTGPKQAFPNGQLGLK